MHCWFVSIFLTSTVFPVVMNHVALIFTEAVERPKRVYTHILTSTIIVSTLIHVWGERLITWDTMGRRSPINYDRPVTDYDNFPGQCYFCLTHQGKL